MIVKVLPAPYTDFTEIVPWSNSISFLQIDNPKPVPSRFLSLVQAGVGFFVELFLVVIGGLHGRNTHAYGQGPKRLFLLARELSLFDQPPQPFPKNR